MDAWYPYNHPSLMNVDPPDREFIAALSPDRVLALIAELEAARERAAKQHEANNRIATDLRNLEDYLDATGECEASDLVRKATAALEAPGFSRGEHVTEKQIKAAAKSLQNDFVAIMKGSALTHPWPDSEQSRWEAIARVALEAAMIAAAEDKPHG